MTKETCCVKRLNGNNAVLVVVDMQERLVPAMMDNQELVETVAKLIRGCRLLDVPSIFTQQYTKGLGATIPEIAEVAVSEVESIDAGAEESAIEDAEDSAAVQEQEIFSFVEKHAFSVVGEPDFNREMKRYEVTDIIVCGIESHVCVMQSVLDFLGDGYNVYVAADACSSRYDLDYDRALARMAASGAVITTTEAILFELLGDAKNPRFKEISKLVK